MKQYYAFLFLFYLFLLLKRDIKGQRSQFVTLFTFALSVLERQVVMWCYTMISSLYSAAQCLDTVYSRATSLQLSSSVSQSTTLILMSTQHTSHKMRSFVQAIQKRLEEESSEGIGDQTEQYGYGQGGQRFLVHCQQTKSDSQSLIWCGKTSNKGIMK